MERMVLGLYHLRDRELYPLQVILREILISNDIQAMNGGAGGDAEAIAQSIKYATIMVATVPILFVYPFLQNILPKAL